MAGVYSKIRAFVEVAATSRARGSTRSPTSCGRPVSQFRRSNERGRLSRGPSSLHPAHRP